MFRAIEGNGGGGQIIIQEGIYAPPVPPSGFGLGCSAPPPPLLPLSPTPYATLLDALKYGAG